jgi:8-oxo-dGTP pyrophosphatase MutT (NUDIX family)
MSPMIQAHWDEGSFGLRSAGIMLDSLGRVLLCRLEDDEEVWWMIPGGSVELHESSEQTLMREFVEEANFDIMIERLLWIEEGFFKHEEVRWHGLGFYYLVSPRDASGIWE